MTKAKTYRWKYRWKYRWTHRWNGNTTNTIYSNNMSRNTVNKASSKTSNNNSSTVALPAEASTSASEFMSAAAAIKLEPETTLNKFEEILRKRKAEKLLQSSSNFLTSEAASSNDSIVSQQTTPKKAKLSVLDQKVKEAEANQENVAETSSFMSTTPPRANQQPLKTMVQYNVYCVEGEQPGEEIAVCITICNIFGLKDQLLGNKPMPNGDYFYWPARMLYSHQVATTMEAAGNILPESASFLKTANGRPLIVLSRLSKVKPDSLLSFKEIDEFLPTFIQGRTDEASNTTPKKIFDLNVIRSTLSDLELDALIAISAKICA